MCRDIERNRSHTRSDIHRHRRIMLVRNCRVNKQNEASFVPKKDALGLGAQFKFKLLSSEQP
jgi:hypothetical protein